MCPKEGQEFAFDTTFLYSRSGNSYEHARRKMKAHIKMKASRRSGFPNFHKGSVITFRLDLTESGTLRAQVNKDSSNEFVLFENILREGE